MRQILVLFMLLSFQISAQTSPADSIVSFAKKHLGIGYCYAKCSANTGFDCSGFVYYVFQHFNIKVPRASIDYEKIGRVIPSDSASIGDIIIFTGTNSKIRKPGHVGIVLSNPGESMKFIHSSSGKKANGVIISTYESSPYYQKRFIKTIRLSEVTR